MHIIILWVHIPSTGIILVSTFPFPVCMHVTDEFINWESVVIRSVDTSITTPLSLVLFTRVATVLELIGLRFLSPTSLKVANSSRVPPDSMYSSLVQARTWEPRVSQVSVITFPGQWVLSNEFPVISWELAVELITIAKNN